MATPDYCMAHGCASMKKKHTNNPTSMFRIPRDKVRGIVWLLNAGRIDLLDEPVEYWYEAARVCVKHFLPDMFMNPKAKLLRLVHDAVPTEFGTPRLLQLANHKELRHAICRRSQMTVRYCIESSLPVPFTAQYETKGTRKILEEKYLKPAQLEAEEARKAAEAEKKKILEDLAPASPEKEKFLDDAAPSSPELSDSPSDDSDRENAEMDSDEFFEENFEKVFDKVEAKQNKLQRKVQQTLEYIAQSHKVNKAVGYAKRRLENQPVPENAGDEELIKENVDLKRSLKEAKAELEKITRKGGKETELAKLRAEIVTVKKSLKDGEARLKEAKDTKLKAEQIADENLNKIFAVLSEKLTPEVYKQMRHEILNTVAMALDENVN